MPNTEVRTLQSSYVDQKFKLFISLPEGYHQSEEHYPVLYVTDANWCFNIFANQIVSWLPVPEMIIVGIGYPTDDNDAINHLRSRDFLATQDQARKKAINENIPWTVESGGGGAFLSFIREELFGFVDKQYRTKREDRTFFGFSWGGTFGVYTLFNQPDTFQRYIISAPDLSWDNQISFSYERDYANAFPALPVAVYFGIGTLDEDMIEHNFSLLVHFHTAMESRKYEGLKMKLGVYVDATHISAVMPTAYKGLQFVFSDG